MAPDLDVQPSTPPLDGKARPVKRPAVGGKGFVPFISSWSGEKKGPMPMVIRRGRKGIGYADERTFDRDRYGVLWERTPSEPGKGTPQLGKVHSLRQRLCMAELRCQVCSGPADRTSTGVLWLIDTRPGVLLPGEEDTGHPPVCRPCAQRSVHACAHLRKAWTAVRVHDYAPMGVKGTLYFPTPDGPKVADAVNVVFSDPRIAWVRAHQLFIRLLDFTVIDLNNPAA